MAERLVVYPVSGRNAVEISVTRRRRLIAGGKEEKYLLTGSVASALRRKPVSLVERGFGNKADEYRENWEVSRSAGLPVVPTLRQTSYGTIVVTDVKADGSEVYGKGLYTQLVLGEKRSRPRKKIDAIFQQMMTSDELNRIRLQAVTLVERATGSEISLPFDDPFELLVHPSGAWQLMTLDLRFGGQRKGDPRLSRENSAAVVSFFQHLELLNRELDPALQAWRRTLRRLHMRQ